MSGKEELGRTRKRERVVSSLRKSFFFFLYRSESAQVLSQLDLNKPRKKGISINILVFNVAGVHENLFSFKFRFFFLVK